MSISSLTQGLSTRLWVIGIPKKLSKDLLEEFVKWIRCSGKEWTIRRCKSLKVDLFRDRAGLPLLTWVRKNRSGAWKGPVGRLFAWAKQSERNFRKTIQVLMLYSTFVFDKVTDKQRDKFLGAISAPKASISTQFRSSFISSVKKLKKLHTDRCDNRLLSYQGSPDRKRPVVGSRTSVRQDSSSASELEIFDTPWGYNLLHHFPSVIQPVIAGMSVNTTSWFQPWSYVDPYQLIGGKIAFLQEPGGKLRSIASPYLLHQLALKPLGNALYKALLSLPWDCTHDQSKPILSLQEHLSEGLKVHSVDLSSATDFFPLEIQMDMLKARFGDIPDISYFGAISQSQWYCDNELVRWNRGQPLGLYPSFATFAMTHGLILWFLSGCHYNDDFYVLGDDVVILDDTLHRKYMELLDSWGCPHSPEKSISSDEICEFAGMVITPLSITRQMKWRELSNDNFIDICRLLGPRSRILCTPRQREIFDLVKHCSLPNGLNFSYEGSDHRSMYERHVRTFGSEKQLPDSLVDLSPILNKNLFTDKRTEYFDPSPSEAKNTSDAFVEKADKLLSSLLPWFTSKRREQVKSVPAAFEKEISEKLPMAVPVSRLTTLDRYAKFLTKPSNP